jgi:hypothetical protein
MTPVTICDRCKRTVTKPHLVLQPKTDDALRLFGKVSAYSELFDLCDVCTIELHSWFAKEKPA